MDSLRTPSWRCVRPSEREIRRHLGIDANVRMPLFLQWTAKKGYVMIANRAFATGDVIFREKPLFTLTKDWDSKEALACVENLSRQKQDLFVRLKAREARQDEDDVFVECQDLIFERESLTGTLIQTAADAFLMWRIITTNAFGVEVDVDDTLSHISQDAVLAIASRMCHSCIPNALIDSRLWDNDDHCVIHAVQDIRRGEEITISYIGEEDLQRDFLGRQLRLVNEWDFWCKCDVCDEEMKRKGFGAAQQVARQHHQRGVGQIGPFDAQSMMAGLVHDIIGQREPWEYDVLRRWGYRNLERPSTPPALTVGESGLPTPQSSSRL